MLLLPGPQRALRAILPCESTLACLNPLSPSVAYLSASLRSPSISKGKMLNKDNGRITQHLRELLSLFPYDFARPAQLAALEIIAQMFSEDIHFSMIEAPTGTGKSALAIAVARYAATLGDGDYEPGAYILTPFNNLAEQMTADFADLGLTALRGRLHYVAQPPGAYAQARNEFVESPMGVTSYAYFLRACHLTERQVLILDEAHTLERILLDIAGFAIQPRTLQAIGIDTPPRIGMPGQDGVVDWLGATLLPALRMHTSRCRDSAARLKWEELAERVAEYIDIADRSQWIAWAEEGTFSVKPLSVTLQANELFARARFVLIQSATIFDFRTFRRILGIREDALTCSAPSDFPLCNRPILYRPAGDMAVATMGQTIPRLCTEIERIVGEFSQSKGVVHTHSYTINRRVAMQLAAKYGNRIITHGQNAQEREQAILRHRISEGATVLVSPSLTEGVDLKDDLARFQVVCKVPYPRLDTYARARRVRDRGWYELQTAWALVQMIGRAVRSEADSAVTFILDSQFEKFVARNEGILPMWWRAAIQWEKKAA